MAENGPARVRAAARALGTVAMVGYRIPMGERSRKRVLWVTAVIGCGPGVLGTGTGIDTEATSGAGTGGPMGTGSGSTGGSGPTGGPTGGSASTGESGTTGQSGSSGAIATEGPSTTGSGETTVATSAVGSTGPIGSTSGGLTTGGAITTTGTTGDAPPRCEGFDDGYVPFRLSFADPEVSERHWQAHCTVDDVMGVTPQRVTLTCTATQDWVPSPTTVTVEVDGPAALQVGWEVEYRNLWEPGFNSINYGFGIFARPSTPGYASGVPLAGGWHGEWRWFSEFEPLEIWVAPELCSAPEQRHDCVWTHHHQLGVRYEGHIQGFNPVTQGAFGDPAVYDFWVNSVILQDIPFETCCWDCAEDLLIGMFLRR